MVTALGMTGGTSARTSTVVLSGDSMTLAAIGLPPISSETELLVTVLGSRGREKTSSTGSRNEAFSASGAGALRIKVSALSGAAPAAPPWPASPLPASLELTPPAGAPASLEDTAAPAAASKPPADVPASPADMPASLGLESEPQATSQSNAVNATAQASQRSFILSA